MCAVFFPVVKSVGLGLAGIYGSTLLSVGLKELHKKLKKDPKYEESSDYKEKIDFIKDAADFLDCPRKALHKVVSAAGMSVVKTVMDKAMPNMPSSAAQKG